MIHSFTVTNHLGESLVLTLADPDSSGLAIESVTGLGQVQADVNLTKLAGSDYSTVNSANLTTRNIVFKIKYWGDNIEASRHKCDKFFPVKKQITLVAKTDERELMLTGIVEKNEPNIFSKESGCQISILCPDPFWYSLEEKKTPFSGITPGFEFPFESDIAADDTIHTIEFGNIRTIKDNTIYYTGDAEVGITINIHATDIVKGLIIYNLDKREQISIDDEILKEITSANGANGSSICQGDDIIISTIKSKKYATLIRNGKAYNIINALGNNRSWFELSRGDNTFTYSASEGEYNLVIEIKNRVLFEGL